MTDIRLATTPAVGHRRLAAYGQTVVGAHKQLGSILANRLSERHARLLARPEMDAGDGRIDWYAPPSAAAHRIDELSADDRQAVETTHRRLVDDIARLAATMRAEGGSAALVAHMLELAMITPSGSLLWAVGEQPVLVNWGHAAQDQAVPEPPPAGAPMAPPVSAAAPEPSSPPPPVAPSSGPAAETPGPAPGAPAPVPEARPAIAAALAATPSGRGWLAWLLPALLLLLLAWLVWRALQPLSPVIVEHQAPAPPPAADPAIAEAAAETALRAELAGLTEQRDRELALCKPLPPPPPPVPPPPEAAPSPKAETAPGPAPKKPAPPPKVEAKKAEPAPKIEAKKAVPAAKPEPKPAEAPKDVAPKDVAMVPPPPPRSACRGDYPPGDEPEVVVIVDGSGSMREPYAGAPSRMAMAKDAISYVVDGLPQPVDVALVDFSDCDRVRLDKFYSAPQRGSLIGEVRALQPDRGTPLARSIERAGNIVSSGVASTIVVVSDGADTCGRDPCAAARAVKARRPNVAINVIDVSGGDGAAMAQCIAGAGGGKVLTPNSPMDMKTKVQQATRLPDTRNCK